MKKSLLELLICPACLPGEVSLDCHIFGAETHDIIDGMLDCPQCGRQYPIRSGIADLMPDGPTHSHDGNKYETEPVVSAYLWSHYGDIMGEETASDAYARWAALMQPHAGISLDAGSAVGRFAFEMSTRCDFAIGIDNSRAFIRTARTLMQTKQQDVFLKEEGNLTRKATIRMPAEWDAGKVEFIVGDAMALPFRSNVAASFASLNLIDKVPSPIRHLVEMNRVTSEKSAQFLLSDPFSWSEEAAEVREWLGGHAEGPFAGRGVDNIARILTNGYKETQPKWALEKQGHVWWKIRTHANHYEQIRSCYVKARR